MPQPPFLPPPRVDDLRSRWTALVPDAPGVADDLLARYVEPTRHYHDQRHLAEVLEAIDLLAAEADDVTAVRLAGWFHDAIYDPRRSDNEEASARLADELLHGTSVSGRRAEVARLVRLTVHHAPDPRDVDGGVLCDADLAILAASPVRYGEYVAGVRAEYAHLDDPAFRAGRSAILDRLLSRERLYTTRYGREHWEERARRNLTAELALLRR
ncbi:putative metal-dependent HD superfamily phosphohydrolase [Thermasporomyces composti]|uniref:Putative metal-dependent HD superfamily phosphohydrolase n=1 Tax=Thermasporomyces composti TaxID=696763 RepID=A0A3D9V318_THECX|nr:putative metal-dependent HD superfamily phosphohydrolase [Thermasporomyces composti]